MPALAVTYYTVDTPYEKEAHKLVRSCQKWSMPIEAVPVENKPTWEENCAQKPRVCREVMEASNMPVLFLDADCWLKASLPIFQGNRLLDCDIATQCVSIDNLRPPMEATKLRPHAAKHGGVMMNSGVCYLANRPAVVDFLHDWESWCFANPDRWDQIGMQELVTTHNLNHRDLGNEYRAGGDRIGHRSAFHRFHGQSRPAKWLLLGSAPYIEDWWYWYGSRYVDAGFFIAAMNNAWRVAGKHLHVWYRPDDFRGNNPDNLPSGNESFYEHPDGWRIGPYWERQGRLSFVDTCHHILNMYACTQSRKVELHVAGSDFIYPDSGPTHFYGSGGLDPLRYGDDFVGQALGRLHQHYQQAGSSIYNAGGQRESRLPFPRKLLCRY
jgi:hypothetical protein